MPSIKKNNTRRKGRLPKIEVVDLFSGIGGLSYGMESRRLKILFKDINAATRTSSIGIWMQSIWSR